MLGLHFSSLSFGSEKDISAGERSTLYSGHTADLVLVCI